MKRLKIPIGICFDSNKKLKIIQWIIKIWIVFIVYMSYVMCACEYVCGRHEKKLFMEQKKK